MAATLNDDDLSVSLPPSQQDDRSDRAGGTVPPSTGDTPSAMAMPPPHARPVAKASRDVVKQSPATTRDMQRLDQYQTVKILGEGSFGKVKLAIHQPSGRQVALKIISRRKLLSRDMVGRVEREIQYLQLLRHPHIIKLYSILPSHLFLLLFVLPGTAGCLLEIRTNWLVSPRQLYRNCYQNRYCNGPGIRRERVVRLFG